MTSRPGMMEEVKRARGKSDGGLSVRSRQVWSLRQWEHNISPRQRKCLRIPLTAT